MFFFNGVIFHYYVLLNKIFLIYFKSFQNGYNAKVIHLLKQEKNFAQLYKEFINNWLTLMVLQQKI